MKCTIPEISWHNKEPVLSVDIQQVENIDAKFYRLASAGSDNHVLIWQLKIQENGAAAIELLSDLTRHQRSVNVVRWSPNGQYLASADDDANIIIWTLKMDNIPSLDGEDENRESWIVYKVLRGHKEDIYDMCWSPDGSKLLTGSIDNTAIVWDVAKGKNEHIITDHKSFVQGVAWNPMHQPPYMATLSSDRTCRILDTTTPRYQIRYRIARGNLPLPAAHPLSQSCANPDADGVESVLSGVKLFHDDTFKTYFRRLAFTPDGSLLLVPSGYVEVGGGGGDGVKGDGDGKAVQERKVLYGTYVFPTMGSFSNPSAILVSPRQCTIAVRCCPLLFELRPNGPEPYVQLPYRMVFAIATDSDVVLYDTQQSAPFAHLQNIHYTRLTDLTWSPDGRILIAASTDGFCTIVTFEPNEIGTVYVKEESEAEECTLNISAELPETPMEIEQEIIANIPIPIEVKKKKPSFLDQWAKVSKKSPKTDDKISGLSSSGKKEFISEKQSPVKSKTANESFGRARTVLFVNESDATEGSKVKDSKEDNLDCEFIDLSNSLSNDGEKHRRRITPILLSSIKKDITESVMKSPNKITSITTMKPSIATESKTLNDSNKRRITPILISKKDELSKSTEHTLSKHIQERSFESEIINLTTNKPNNPVQNKNNKRSVSPSVMIKSKSPPSAKKFKTNTLLNFVQRGPKNSKSSTSNQNTIESKKTAFNTIGNSQSINCSSDKSNVAQSKVPIEKLTSILTEESARDSWKCDLKPAEIILDLTEDIPEDFNLQIEESTNTNIEKTKMQKESEEETKEECGEGVLIINDVEVDTCSEEPILNKNTEHVNDNKSKVCDTEHSENKYSNTNDSENNLQKIKQCTEDDVKAEDKTINITELRTEGTNRVKRRVPLITLSSPKNKNKPVTESHL